MISLWWRHAQTVTGFSNVELGTLGYVQTMESVKTTSI